MLIKSQNDYIGFELLLLSMKIKLEENHLCSQKHFVSGPTCLHSIPDVADAQHTYNLFLIRSGITLLL